MIEKKILVKNIETNYKVIGQGRPMLVLHGWPSSSDKWQAVAELLAQKNIMAVIPDLPGFGKSQRPPASWSIDNYVEWAHEFSNAISEFDKGFYLLGHSFGGAISIKFSVKYNQRIEKLFLVSAACIRNQTIIKKVLRKISKFIKLFSFLPYYGLMRKAFYKFVIKKSDYPYIDGIMKETYLRVIAEDLSQYVTFLKVPTVIIWGTKDSLTPVENAYIIHKKIENSTLIIIDGAGHNLNKIPEKLSEKILEQMPPQILPGEILSLKNII